MQFESPWVLLLAPLVAVLPLLRHWAAARHAGLTFSSAALPAAVTPSLRQRVAWLPLVLQVASLVLLVVALARPREGQGTGGRRAPRAWPSNWWWIGRRA